VTFSQHFEGDERSDDKMREIHRSSGVKAKQKAIRPRCRKAVIEHQLSPYPSVCGWDGFSAYDRGR
jgi:hypothetical protein